MGIFFDKFKSKIGKQWFGLAQLVYYYETDEKVNLKKNTL
jgi:hypothetical protein